MIINDHAARSPIDSIVVASARQHPAASVDLSHPHIPACGNARKRVREEDRGKS
eukprot:m.447569 g.447569  ORF g.447569 m.447569 type:complete len:54 (-) comp157438_c0_seq1:171-332(-)